MTEGSSPNDEARTGASTRSRFAKFNEINDTNSEESTNDDDNNDADTTSSSESDTLADSNVDRRSSNNKTIDNSDPQKQTPNESHATRLWSDATITDRTNSDSDGDNITPSSDQDPENAIHDRSDSTISTDSTQQSAESTTDSSQADSNRMWNQLSRSDAREEMNTTTTENKDNSVRVNRMKTSEKTTSNSQIQNNSVNTTQTDIPAASQSQSQPLSSSSFSSDTADRSTQTDPNVTRDTTVSGGSQSLLLGQNNPETWNVGFDHILETQQPQNLLLLVPAGEAVDVLRTCQEHNSWDGGEIIIIKIGASVPGDVSIAELSGDGMKESIETHQISDQTDLSRLGILLTQVLDEWQQPDQRTVCSIHTLQASLQYLSPQKVFQFLHTLSRRLKSANINTNYLMTPSDGDRTINTLRPLFDTVIET